MQFTIKQARTYAGLTQKKMADLLGIDRGTYIRIERDLHGAARVGQIISISKITGISLSDIFLPLNSTLVDHSEK